MRARLICSLLAIGALFGVTAVAAPAAADPGVCKCNSGCHANPGQCVQGNGCNIGYAPTCGYRGGDAGGTASCPKTTYISCDGMCECVPIPGFCSTIGGADYCDAGPPPDATTGDTSVTDTGTPTDTGVKVDTGTPTDAKIDSGKPPTDSGLVTDAPAVDSCVPFPCPMGTKTVHVSGLCDPYCAPPCGTGEFKCSPGLSCSSDGFCYPGSVGDDGGFSSCVLPGAPPCGACRQCDLTTGSCFDDPACSDGGTTEDGAVSDADMGDGAATDDASTGDGGEAQPEANGDDTGGCGCSIPGQESSSGATALVVGAAALVIATRRRRR